MSRFLRYYSKLLGFVLRAVFALLGVSIGPGLKARGLPVLRCKKRGQIRIGSKVSLLSQATSNALGLNHPVMVWTLNKEAVIEIGNRCGLSGATVVARNRIEIGNDVQIGANAVIMDNDFHPLDPILRAQGSLEIESAPIVIEDHAWIGLNAIILKGVTVGKNSIIGAGAVVTKDVPAGTIVAGNPARVIRQLNLER